MFCPNCGKAEQTETTYCRQCGEFLAKNDNYSPENLIKTNLTFSLMSAVVSLLSAVLLYAVLGFRENTHPVIYVIAALQLALCAWQFSTFAVGLKLRKKLGKGRDSSSGAEQSKTVAHKQFRGTPTAALLPEADFKNDVSRSVVENTTRKLRIER